MTRIFLVLLSAASADELSAEAARRVAHIVFSKGISAREGFLQEPDVAAACSKLPECARDCKATLEWLGDRGARRLSLARLTGRPDPPPAPRPAQLCADAPPKLDGWPRARLAELARAALASAVPDDADRLRCGMERLQGRESRDACRRAEPRWMAEEIHALVGVDASMVEVLAYKGCEELDGCAGACKAEMLEMAALVPRRIKRHQGCDELSQRPSENLNKWKERAGPVAMAHLMAYLAEVREALDPGERAGFDCDLGRARLTLMPVGATCR